MIFEAPDWAAYELAAMRAVLAATIIRASLVTDRGNRLSAPVGLATLVDLRWFVAGRSRSRLELIGQLALLAFVADVAPTASVTIAAVWALLALTAGLSDGATSHGRHLPVVALIGQAAGSLAWEINSWLDGGTGSFVLEGRGATGTWWAIQLVLATYFVSGVSKLAGSRFLWAWQSPNLLLAVLARLETAKGAPGSAARAAQSEALARRLIERPTLTRLMLGGGLLLELAAPIGLVNRWTLLAAGVALLLLHQANGVLLRLPFRKWQGVLIGYLVNVPYLVVEAAHGLGID